MKTEILASYQWMISLHWLIVISLVGMVMHFLKKGVKGETLLDIKTYFTNNFKSTVIAVVATVIGTLGVYFTLMPAPDHITGETIALLVITSFGTGYTFDSLFNKWDKPQ